MKPIRLALPALLAYLVLSACEREGTGEEVEVDIAAHIEQNYPGCSSPQYCGDLVYVNCHSEVDGPAYYLDRKTGQRISACGGACWFPDSAQAVVCRTLCPPKEWTCNP